MRDKLEPVVEELPEEVAEREIAAQPDAVEWLVRDMATGTRIAHVRYSATLTRCVVREGQFVPKRSGGKVLGYERRGEQARVVEGEPPVSFAMTVAEE